MEYKIPEPKVGDYVVLRSGDSTIRRIIPSGIIDYYDRWYSWHDVISFGQSGIRQPEPPKPPFPPTERVATFVANEPANPAPLLTVEEYRDLWSKHGRSNDRPGVMHWIHKVNAAYAAQFVLFLRAEADNYDELSHKEVLRATADKVERLKVQP